MLFDICGRQRLKITVLTLALVLVPALAAGGCGSSTKTAATTKAAAVVATATKQPAPETFAANEKLELTSPVIDREGPIPVRYTCDGKDTPPPFRWEAPPPGTAEFMLDILKLKAVNNKLYFAWAITGIKPNLRQIDPPHLPPGTITGTNSNGEVGYHLCPPKGALENYVAVLFAVPRHLPASPGFDATQLRNEALHSAKYQSLFGFHYTHP